MRLLWWDWVFAFLLVFIKSFIKKCHSMKLYIKILKITRKFPFCGLGYGWPYTQNSAFLLLKKVSWTLDFLTACFYTSSYPGISSYIIIRVHTIYESHTVRTIRNVKNGLDLKRISIFILNEIRYRTLNVTGTRYIKRKHLRSYVQLNDF